MLDIEVLSKCELEGISTVRANTMLISITDFGCDFAKLNKMVSDTLTTSLFIRFEDVEAGEKNCITSEDSERILEFVESNIERCEHILINCDGGVSRSAGVAVALATILGIDDGFIWNNSRLS